MKLVKIILFLLVVGGIALLSNPATREHITATIFGGADTRQDAEKILKAIGVEVKQWQAVPLCGDGDEVLNYELVMLTSGTKKEVEKLEIAAPAQDAEYDELTQSHLEVYNKNWKVVATKQPANWQIEAIVYEVSEPPADLEASVLECG